MQEYSIRVEGLTKCYRLYEKRTDRLKEALHLGRNLHRDFYALKDVSFDVRKGETLGVIGRNGAGKSTLLKLISGIAHPTAGSVTVRGSMSSLLELGVGFNPEMTGVENVLFSGAIMGFGRDEMEQRLDPILAFADIGDFVYQPVKTYSSGMIVRLAFSVAITVEPEILVIDEALAVGDIRFQQKCFRRLHELKEKGRTILLVTHDLGAVRTFCDRALWLHEGSVRGYGQPDRLVRDYAAFMFYEGQSNGTDGSCADQTDESAATDVVWSDLTSCESFGEGGAVIHRISFSERDRSGIVSQLAGGEMVTLILDIEAKKDIQTPIIGFQINDEHGNHVVGSNTAVLPGEVGLLQAGDRKQVRFDFRFPRLRNGSYVLSPAIAEGTLDRHIQHHWIHDAHIIDVRTPDPASSLGWYVIPEDASFSVGSVDSTVVETPVGDKL